MEKTRDKFTVQSFQKKNNKRIKLNLTGNFVRNINQGWKRILNFIKMRLVVLVIITLITKKLTNGFHQTINIFHTSDLEYQKDKRTQKLALQTH